MRGAFIGDGGVDRVRRDATQVSDAGTAWAVVAAALGASLLTSLGAWWLESRRTPAAQRESRRAALVEACVQLFGGAFRLSHSANSTHETLIQRSGLSDRVDVLLHQRKPLDYLELGDCLWGTSGRCWTRRRSCGCSQTRR